MATNYRNIKGRVTPEQYKRLEEIRRDYNFKSIYEITNYLLYSFLRVVDKNKDMSAEPVPTEIEDMFNGYESAQERCLGQRPKRRCNTSIGGIDRV